MTDSLMISENNFLLSTVRNGDVKIFRVTYLNGKNPFQNFSGSCSKKHPSFQFLCPRKIANK